MLPFADGNLISCKLREENCMFEVDFFEFRINFSLVMWNWEWDNFWLNVDYDYWFFCGILLQEIVENDIASNEPVQPQNTHNSTPSHIDIGKYVTQLDI